MMEKEEILELYEVYAGFNGQDLIKILEEKLDCGTTRSLDGSLVIFHQKNSLVVVDSCGPQFFNLTK